MLNEFKEDKNIISRQIEKKYFTKKGKVFWGLVTVTAIRDNEDKIIYLVGQIQNLTQIKNAEKELKKYAEKLNGLNSSKDKFFSIISHDLRSPFNALLSNSEYVATSYDELTPDEVKESVKNIYGSAKKIYELVRNLLEWSQVQLGRLEVQKCEINLCDLSEKVISLYKEFTDNKKILIKNEISKNISVYADRNMIETIMRNLFSNAAKFTPNNGSIKISAAEKENFAEISIADTGMGISAEDQKRLFRIDEQFNTEGTESEKGTGLGLILSKEFVELNGGKISVVSKLNSGSKFRFTVPLFDKESEPK